MGEAVVAMTEKIEPLRQATLPERLAERQGEFDAGVSVLAERLAELDATLQGSDDEAIQAAVDALHSAYGALEGVFE